MMTVNGIGTLSIEPDVAKIQLGVVTQNQELTQAQQQNAQLLNQVLQSLQKLGISEENIQTVDFTIYPQYDYVDGKQEFRGYEVMHTILVTIENLAQTGSVIDTAVQNGANKVSNIQFTVENPQSYYEQALSTALVNALAKAQTIADTLQLNLDPSPIKVLEKTNDEPPSTYKTFSSTADISTITTPIETGQLDIVAKVETQFQYFE